MNITAFIFSKIPSYWGLKGDYFLWEDLKKHFSNTAEIPSERSFLDELYHAFETFTGKPVKSNHIIYVDKYDGEHLTSGLVDPRSWYRIIFPQLISRFRDIRIQSL